MGYVRLIRPGLLATAAALVVMAALTAAAWGGLPERVAVHWNAAGEADGWARRPVAVAMTPLILLGVSVLLAVVPLLDPRRANLERSAKAYLAAWIGLAVLLTGTHAVVLFAAGSGDLPVTRAILVLTGGLLMVVGNYLGKTRSNWFAGIRTPWTLSSERSWARTHRLGGRLFVLLGAASIASGLLLPTEVAMWVQLAGLAAVAVTVTVYSYLTWRADPDRETLSRSGT